MALLEFVRERTAEAAAEAAARHIVGGLVASDMMSPVGARLAIPGGSALAAVGPTLRELPARMRRRMHLTWTDERCVPVDDPASNHGTARRQGLVPTDCASVLPLWLAGETPQTAEQRIREAFVQDLDRRIDVALLGLGEDGHIASLFATNAPPEEPLGFVTYVPNAPKPPPARMTLTLGMLTNARLGVLLVTGEGKRDALTRMLRGEENSPARHIGRMIIVTDLEINV